MNPTPAPNPNNTDETALSAQARTPPLGAASEATADGAATDVTVIKAAPSATTVADVEGSSFGKYELLGEIARGGMGVVYRARQHGLDRFVALKMILGTGISHETAMRFLQEARAAAALDHPNVVPIYDIGEIGDRPYFTMALIDGPNLRGHVEAMGTVPIPTAVSLFAQTVAGVAHAHQHGIIHRDLKPANVLIDKDGRPRVTDFGLAKRATTESQLTVTGQVVGTPSYMAPEQARESKDAGPPADVYALGAILYFLLTGRPPFVGDSITDLLIKVVTETVVPPSQLRPDVPAELEALCLRCLAKTPAERFPNADALAEALAPIADRYLTASAGLTPSLGRMGSRPSTPAVGTVPDLMPTTNSGPVLTNAPSFGAASLTGSPPTAPSAPKANNRPLVIGLVAAAVVLVGVIGFLATRGKKDEVAKQDPPPAAGQPEQKQPAPAPVPPTIVKGPEIVKPPELAKGPKIVKGPEIVPLPGGKKDGDKTWAAPSRADFGLKVDVSAPAARKDTDGVIRMSAGSPMTIHLKADKDCRVKVLVIDPTGSTTQLFPNDDDPDDRLVAGKERTVPGNDKYILETNATEGTGLERLRVFATTGEMPSFPPGAKVGRFSVFAGADGDRVASTIRGVTIKKAAAPGPAGEIAEAEIRFHVQK